MRQYFPKQRLTFKQKKADDYQAIKDFVNSIIRYHDEDFYVNDRNDHYNSQEPLEGHPSSYRRIKNMLSNYRLYNNQLDQTDFMEYCDSLGVKKAIGAKVHDIKPYNKTYNKINILVGEEYRRPDNHKVVLVNSEGVREKLFKKQELYREYINAMLQSQILKIQQSYPQPDPREFQSEEEYQAFQEEQQAQIQEKVNSILPPGEIEKYLNTSYLSAKEIAANDLLAYLYHKESIKEIKNDGFKHGLISGEEHVWVGVRNGEPVVEILNPIKVFYHKSPETKYVQDGMYAGYRTDMTVADVLDSFSDVMTEKQKDELEERYGYVGREGDKNIINKHMTYGDLDTIEYKYSSDNELSREGSYGKSYYDDVEVIHLEWVSQRKVGFLSYTDEDGELVVDKVDEEFDIPKYAKKVEYQDKNNIKVTAYEWDGYSLEWEWIPEVWQCTRVDNDMYFDIGPKPNQYYSEINPYKVKLGYYGVVYNNMNSLSQSVMDRMKPFQYLFFVAMDKFKDLIAKDKGQLVKIDASRLDPKFPIEKTIHFLEQAGYYITNELQNAEAPGASNRSSVEAINASNIGNIINFAQVLSYFDEQISDAAGIAKAREGSTQPYEAVGVNQQSIIQSSIATEYYFMAHDHLWREIKNGLLETAQKAYEENPLVTQYVLSDGSRKALNVDGDTFENAELGLFVANSGKELETHQMLQSYVQALIQNDKIDAEDVIHVLSTDSPEELKRALIESKKNREKREEQMAQMQQEHEAKLVEMEIESREDQQEHEIMLKRMEIEGKMQTAAIDVEKFSRQWDIDNNQRSDNLQKAEMDAKVKLELQQKELEFKEKELEKKTASAEKIAKMKPKPSSK